MAKKPGGRRRKDSQNDYVHNSKGMEKAQSTLKEMSANMEKLSRQYLELEQKKKPLKFRTAVVKGQLIKGTISNNPDAGKMEEIETQDLFNNTDNQKGIVFKVKLC